MRHRVLPALLVSATLALTVAASAQPVSSKYVVHEWGTFTSIAGANGGAIEWLPLGPQIDLPCFVERDPGNPNLKLSTSGTVRMETPVLYFYSPRAAEASVHVSFPQGRITEWYPHATVPKPTANVNGSIEWPIVAIQPGAREAFPIESASSHYYAARQTDADPVRVGAKPEKFLFYRGVGQFQPPVTAVAREDGGVDLRSTADAALGDVVLFENRSGAMTFTTQHLTAASATLSRPSLDDASGAPVAELKQILMSNGLYPREAQAMVDTWKDSWFEEGTRLLYILPRAADDAILPLTITPRPASLTRVFVGRIELMSPATLSDVRAAITSGDLAAMKKYSRFLSPIADRLWLEAKIPPAVYALSSPSLSTCR
jgi:hypothetical protein